MQNVRRVSKFRLAVLTAALMGGSLVLNATDAASQYAQLESRDRRFDELIPPDTKIEKIADDLDWSEGPLWDARRKTLLFSDIPRNVIMQWNADTGVSRSSRVVTPPENCARPLKVRFAAAGLGRRRRAQARFPIEPSGSS